jgi:hypothetical protein
MLNTWKKRGYMKSRSPWIAKLFDRLNTWINRQHGKVNYYLKNILMEYDLFHFYLHEIGKIMNPIYFYCIFLNDDALYTFFHYRR